MFGTSPLLGHALRSGETSASGETMQRSGETSPRGSESRITPTTPATDVIWKSDEKQRAGSQGCSLGPALLHISSQSHMFAMTHAPRVCFCGVDVFVAVEQGSQHRLAAPCLYVLRVPCRPYTGCKFFFSGPDSLADSRKRTDACQNPARCLLCSPNFPFHRSSLPHEYRKGSSNSISSSGSSSTK